MKKMEFAKYNEFYFHYVDYIVFSLMLILSTGTGLYFGYYKKKMSVMSLSDGSEHQFRRKKNDFGSKKMNEYLLGSRKLKIFPVAMSLVASYISGVTILGTPSEIYNYGTQYWLIVVSIIFMGLTVATVYLPVFAMLRVGSSYEYLELRFNSNIRSIASFMFVMDEIFFLPIVVYVPALAFNQVTGVHVHIVSAGVCFVCVLYTLLGGIKAVVHTDAWQILVMFVAVLVIVILGTFVSDGPLTVFRRANEGGRIIFFNFNPSLYERQTFWGVLFGGFAYWTSFNSVNQTMVQRYMSLPTLKKARQSIAIFILGVVLFLSVCCYSGLLIYDIYKNCDPFTTGLISNSDQLLPIYVMQTVGHLHGIPGLFIAGIFGAALSSLSVILNSTSLVFLEDIVKGCFKIKPSEKTAHILVRGCTIFLGFAAMSLIFVLEKLSGILSVATSVTSIAAGTTFGLFTLGMLIPWSNSKGAYAGAAVGALMSGWVSFGTQAAMASNLVIPPKLNVSVSECPFNVTIPEAQNRDESDVFPLYRLSFHWISPIGILSTVLVGTLVSLCTGPRKIKTLEADLVSPILHRFLPRECFMLPRTSSFINKETPKLHLTQLLDAKTKEPKTTKVTLKTPK